jgi:SAM-dependent methyltransferase
VRADATVPPFAARTFDLVCALDVLEHLADDRAALGAIHHVLKPGGALLLSVPALRVLWGRQDVLAGHHRRYRRHELRERVLAAGFAIERLAWFNTWMFLPILAVRLAMRPFLRSTGHGTRSDFAVGSGWLDRPLGAVFGSEAGLVARGVLPIGVSLLCLARRA